LILEDDSTYPHPGGVVAINRQVDPRTGTIAVVGSFPNPGNLLRPGQYGKIRAAVDVRKGALLVPVRALNEIQGRTRSAWSTATARSTFATCNVDNKSPMS